MSTMASIRRPYRASRLARPGIALFLVSAAFPVIACLMPVDRRPAPLGWLDVVIALAVIAVGILIDLDTRAHVDADAQRRAYGFYRGLTAVPLALLVAFFVVGNAIDWTVLLIGLAWRTWLLGYVLPGVLVALRPNTS